MFSTNEGITEMGFTSVSSLRDTAEGACVPWLAIG